MVDEYHLSKLDKLCRCSNRLLKDPVYCLNVKMGILKNIYLYWLVEDTILWLLQSGIPQHSTEFHNWITLQQRYFTTYEKLPQILSINDLSFGFILWIITCGIASISFILELTSNTINKLITKLVGFLSFIKLLKLYLKHRM